MRDWIPEPVLSKIIDSILYHRQKTPWSVLGEMFSQDLAKAAQPECPGPIDIEAETRIGIAAELWKDYGPDGVPYVEDQGRDRS